MTSSSLTPLLQKLEQSNLNKTQKARLLCRAAMRLEYAGRYEEAREILSDFWPDVGSLPHISGLTKRARGQLFLRCGVLAGWLGNQEHAKNLISRSIAVFEELEYEGRYSDAQTELAVCYWREGAYDEARVLLSIVVERFLKENLIKAKAVMRLALVEHDVKQDAYALKLLTKHAALFERITNHTIRGCFHNLLAGVLKNLSIKKKRPDFLDRAFIEYEAASYHFELAHHQTWLAGVKANLGFLYYEAGKYAEAHVELEHARRLFMYLKNSVHKAQVNETRSRVYLAEENFAEAERFARAAVTTLEESDAFALLAEALTSHGTALARLGYYGRSRAAFGRAVKVANEAGAVSLARDAATRMVLELGEHLLSDGDDVHEARDVVLLGQNVRAREHELIRQALETSQGSITQAAHLLGMSHQRLTYAVAHKYPDLQTLRKEKQERKKPGSKITT